jgi:hypothetical protein
LRKNANYLIKKSPGGGGFKTNAIMESDRLPLSKNTGRGQNEYRCFANGQQLKKNTGRLGSCQRHGIYGDFLANVPSDPTSFHKWLA